ncbi:serine hydrolase domain-containing protein [Actinomyces oris]|uniref:serine hydrolase domain-containing protein n=1 Tax=Actinomyces oris TaxID=544580 RepID=UPI002115F9B4|nr:serine hydrolase domain-containing protein [Actinomyces oris]
MSASTSPFHRSRPPSQQVRPTSLIRSRGLLPRGACAVLAACLALAVFVVGSHAPKADTSSITGDKDLAKQVIGLLPDDYRARGIHVSVITAEGARHAGIAAASGQQYTSTTPMEIGSITKTFSGRLLADAISRGEVKASDPLSTYLPELAGTPAGEATLGEVASHRSGIPGAPSQDLTWFVLRGHILGLSPFTDSTDQLIEKTRTTKMGKRGEFVYSNLGISLLGEDLRHAAGAESWESYVSERLLTPLDMEHTSLIVGQSEIPDGAVRGGRANGRRGQSLSGPGSNPAGAGVWSTPEDMTLYAQAVLTGAVPGGVDPRRCGGPRRSWPVSSCRVRRSVTPGTPTSSTGTRSSATAAPRWSA